VRGGGDGVCVEVARERTRTPSHPVFRRRGRFPQRCRRDGRGHPQRAELGWRVRVCGGVAMGARAHARITTTAKRTQTFGRQGDGVEITLGLMNAEQ